MELLLPALLLLLLPVTKPPAGMFSFTGMSPAQVEAITRDHHVYLTKDGRISMAGVNTGNVKQLAAAIHAVTKQ